MSRAVLALPLLAALSALPAMAQPAPPKPAASPQAEPAPLICQKGQSAHEEDKETGVVIQKTKVTPRPDHYDPLLVWTSDDPGSVMFAVLGNGERSRYASCAEMTVTVDGKALALGKPHHEQEAGGSRVVEYLTLDLPWFDAEKIGTARAIDYKICNDQYQASPDFVCQARDVIDAAAAWKRAQAAKKAPAKP